MDSSYCVKVQIQPLVHRYMNIPINLMILVIHHAEGRRGGGILNAIVGW
jgi:hypothetical protein